MADPDLVLVLAPNWLGDAVMALPAIADVRHRFPRSSLAVAARPSLSGLFALVPDVDVVITLAWNGRASRVRTLWKDAVRLRRLGAGAVLVLPNSFASALLARVSAAPERWGYRTDGRVSLLTRAVPRPAASMHQSAYYQHLTSALGIPRRARAPQVTVPSSAADVARHLLDAGGWDGVRPVAVCAPGAAYGTAKRWLPEHFAALVTKLVDDADAHVVLVGGAADSSTAAEITSMLAGEVRSRVVDLCGRTSLGALAGVLSLAQVCVSNDSGAMHLAAAVGVPLAALFGPTNERETAPVPRAGVPAHVLIHTVACRPCMLRECPIDHPCMRDLQPARVYTTVKELLVPGGA